MIETLESELQAYALGFKHQEILSSFSGMIPRPIMKEIGIELHDLDQIHFDQYNMGTLAKLEESC